MTNYMIAPTGRKIEDLTGQVFNRLTVLRFANKKDNDNRWLWECECSCDKHNIIYTSMHKLKSGNTKSCGCLQKEKVIQKNKSNALNITGEKKGTLTAIKQIGHSKSGNIWEIQCDCGNIFSMTIGEWNRDKYGDGHRAKYTCPLCQTSSKGQLLLRKIFQENHIKVIEEWTDDGKCINPKTKGILRFDFYLPDYNCCIEYDGEQHFKASGGYFTENFVKQVQERDKIKNIYCENNNIRIVRIPYTDYSKINFQYIQERIGKNER